jgi:hypothetical protein
MESRQRETLTAEADYLRAEWHSLHPDDAAAQPMRLIPIPIKPT